MLHSLIFDLTFVFLASEAALTCAGVFLTGVLGTAPFEASEILSLLRARLGRLSDDEAGNSNSN